MAKLERVPMTSGNMLYKCWFTWDAVIDNITSMETISTEVSTRTIAAGTSGAVGGAMSLNGDIYFVGSDKIIKLNPYTEEITTVSETGMDTKCVILAPDRMIYAIPHISGSTTRVLQINPITDECTEVGGSMPSGRFYGGRLSPTNGCIYCANENDGGKTLKFDPNDFSSYLIGSTVSSGDGDYVHRGSAIAPNGKIYGIAYDINNKGVVIDPVSDTTSLYTTYTNTDAFKCVGGALGPTGKIYTAPSEIDYVEIINPNTNTSTAISHSCASYAFGGAILAPNGRIYLIPMAESLVHEVNTVSNTVTDVGSSYSGSNKWCGGVLSINGKIYCAPYSSTNILVIDTGYTSAPCWLTSPYINSGF